MTCLQGNVLFKIGFIVGLREKLLKKWGNGCKDLCVWVVGSLSTI